MNINKTLEKKVTAWLNEEGYPLEFEVAQICTNHGFRVFQGFHIRDKETIKPREIDVLAQTSSSLDSTLIRAEHVIECKWSKDKPWVAFTSPEQSLLPSACVSQTIASATGRAAL